MLCASLNIKRFFIFLYCMGIWYCTNISNLLYCYKEKLNDILGITSRLEYLKELGVEAALLSPIFKSPMHDFGYDISDYYNIQPEYGSIEDLEQLLTKANELSKSLIIHSSIHYVNLCIGFQRIIKIPQLQLNLSALKMSYMFLWEVLRFGCSGE